MAPWLAALLLVAPSAQPCTIFVLTDGDRTLFCNNEDWEDPNTRIWFIPGRDGFHGAAYLGFDNGWAQGGINSAGLAFDWVSGFREKWERSPGLQSVRGNPSPKMLETCATVDDAIRFYQTHWEPDFARSRILIADASGASVVIGARDGKLHFQRTDQCRGFGYGQKVLEQRLSTAPKAAVEIGMDILSSTRQDGRYATRYSNVFDLKSRRIHLAQPGEKTWVELDLAAELAKGPHLYFLPQLKTQLNEPPRQLPTRFQRNPIDQAKAAPDPEPAVTQFVAQIFHGAAKGALNRENYSEEFWQEISPNIEQHQEDLKALGDFNGLTFLERLGTGAERIYRYKVDFSKAAVLQAFTIRDSKVITASESEMVEWKPDFAPPP